MGENKRIARQPMLYIAQPQFKPAKVSMQSSFRSQRSEQKVEPSQGSSLQEKELRLRNQAQNQTKETSSRKNEELINDRNEPSANETQKNKRQTTRERRQRFQDLSLEEKVQYFFTLSPQVPKMKCEVTTTDNQHRGYITDYKQGIVHMKTFQRPFHKEITFTDIKDIRLMGF